MPKNRGEDLRQLCLNQPGEPSHGSYVLRDPLYVKIWHRRVFDDKGKPVDRVVEEDYAIKVCYPNCFFGDSERTINASLPWWAVKKFKVYTNGG